MLLPMRTLQAIQAGEVDLAFRRWTRPTVKAGGRLRTAIGELSIESVTEVDPAIVTDDDARRAGSTDRAELFAWLDRKPGPLYRVELRLGGADPRIALREDATLGEEDRSAIAVRLARFDRASTRGPWTARTLELITEQPGTRAPDLAALMGVETLWFKGNVRKLKELGLTESLVVGYRLSPRGRAYLGLPDA